MDTLLVAIDRVAEPSTVGIAFLTAVGMLCAARVWHALKRRGTFRTFAQAHHLQFVGIIASDARLPYTRIPVVSSAVLLSNVIEGEWDGLPVRLFEMPKPRRSGRWATAILVTVEDVLERGAEAERAIAAASPALIEANLDVVCVSPMRPLGAAELAVWLSSAVAIAKAMQRDAKSH